MKRFAVRPHGRQSPRLLLARLLPALLLGTTLAAGRQEATGPAVGQAALPGTLGPAPVQYGTPFTEVPAPADVVLYQVNFHAFSPAGDFAGVRARLDEIRALGVNTLYLLPIHPIGEIKSVHSPYCVRDYLAVNPELGTLEDLRALVVEAHARHMAVMLDWVADHTALDHPWIANKAWYKQDADGNIIPPPGTGWNDVAALDFRNADMRRAMIQAMRYWVFAANIDGYRCDAADFVPADFWQEALASLRTISTHQLLFLAEGERRDHFAAGFQLEYGMSFYYNMVNRVFGKHLSARSLDSLNVLEYKDAAPDSQVARYISNHDVDQTDGAPQSLLGGEAGSLAAFVVAAYMKGVPMIYNGQEVGCPLKLSFFDGSTLIDWSLHPDLRERYRQLLAVRNGNEAIRRGELHSYDTDDVCAFTKSLESQRVLVIVNLRGTGLSWDVPSELAGSTWKDALDGTAFELEDRLDLPPYGYRVLKAP